MTVGGGRGDGGSPPAARRARSRHEALAAELLGAIRDGDYAVGDRLPTESALAAEHGMARETVRKALAGLEQAGLIERRPGAGTTVVSDRPVDVYRPVAQSASDVVALARGTRLRDPVSGEVVADAALARRLGCRAGTRWHRLAGARLVKGDDRPVCFSEHYLRGDLDPQGMLHGGVPDPDYTARFRVEQTISAELLDGPVAATLEADPGGPALVVTRRARDRTGRLVNVGIHIHPADRFSITTVLGPAPDA